MVLGHWRQKKPANRDAVRGFVLAIVGSFVLFSFGLKWQPWQNRLLLPCLLLGAPVFGMVIGQFRGSLQWATTALLAISSVPWVVNNTTRPLIGPSGVFVTGRDRQLLASRPELWGPYRDAAEYVAKFKTPVVGLVFGGDAAEYASGC